MRRFVRDYSLSLVLGTLFLVSWVLQTAMGWYEFRAEQHALGETATVVGDGGYLWAWGQATFENWQSEFLQLLAFVVLTSVLVHKGSHESKDSDDELKRAVGRIERRLDALHAARPDDADRRAA